MAAQAKSGAAAAEQLGENPFQIALDFQDIVDHLFDRYVGLLTEVAEAHNAPKKFFELLENAQVNPLTVLQALLEAQGDKRAALWGAFNQALFGGQGQLPAALAPYAAPIQQRANTFVNRQDIVRHLFNVYAEEIADEVTNLIESGAEKQKL